MTIGWQRVPMRHVGGEAKLPMHLYQLDRSYYSPYYV